METLAFEGTIEQEKELKAVFKKYENVPGRLMPVLQDAQGIYGYLGTACYVKGADKVLEEIE